MVVGKLTVEVNEVAGPRRSEAAKQKGWFAQGAATEAQQRLDDSAEVAGSSSWSATVATSRRKHDDGGARTT